MRPEYALSDVSSVFTPALVVYPELIRRNIARVVELAGGPDRLRPHAKTHKTREIARACCSTPASPSTSAPPSPRPRCWRRPPRPTC